MSASCASAGFSRIEGSGIKPRSIHFIDGKSLTEEEMKGNLEEIACPHCNQHSLRLVWIPRGIHFACEKCLHVFDMTARGVHAAFH